MVGGGAKGKCPKCCSTDGSLAYPSDFDRAKRHLLNLFSQSLLAPNKIVFLIKTRQKEQPHCKFFTLFHPFICFTWPNIVTEVLPVSLIYKNRIRLQGLILRHVGVPRSSDSVLIV